MAFNTCKGETTKTWILKGRLQFTDCGSEQGCFILKEPAVLKLTLQLVFNLSVLFFALVLDSSSLS